MHGAGWDSTIATYNQMKGIQATEYLVSALVCVFLPGRSGDEKQSIIKGPILPSSE